MRGGIVKIENVMSAKGLSFVALFSLLALVASNVNFSPILGGASNQSFTFFQFMGPIASGFLGAGAGVLAVLLAQVVSFVYLGQSISPINILLLAPMLFAALYFANYAKGVSGASAGKAAQRISLGRLAPAAVSLVCMALFIAHPVGQQVWYYSLYWLVPAIVLALPENLLLRSYGSTFTAHAIGSTIFLYLVPSAPALWIALIPVVAFERTMFALGITGSYFAFNTVLSKVEAVAKSGMVSIDRRYVLFAQKA